MEALSSFRHHKVGKRSELTLVWLPEDPEEAPVEQVGDATHTYTCCVRTIVTLFELSGEVSTDFLILSPPQIISIFTLVKVQLQADGGPMKYSAVLQRPDKSDSD